MNKTSKIKTVTIPAMEKHEGIHAVSVKLRWICPKCGKPRGKIQSTKSYDGSLALYCDGWTNPCGHVDYYSDVIKEAMSNGLNTDDGGGGGND